MFKYSMVNNRISMIYERLSTAKSNAFYAMQAAQSGQEEMCQKYLLAMKAEMDAIKDQWKDMQIAIDNIKEKEK